MPSELPLLFPELLEPGAADPIICPLGAVGMWMARSLDSCLGSFFRCYNKTTEARDFIYKGDWEFKIELHLFGLW